MRPKPIVDGFKTDQHASQCKGFKISAEVVAPLGGLKRQRSYQEPFNISVYLKIFEDAFLTPTVVYDLPLSTGTDLKCPSLLSALWLLLCRLLQRDYEGAAKLLPFVSSAASDGSSMRQDEQRAFQMALEDTSDRAPDAVAVPQLQFHELRPLIQAHTHLQGPFVIMVRWRR